MSPVFIFYKEITYSLQSLHYFHVIDQTLEGRQ